jgi:hypothetical protein
MDEDRDTQQSEDDALEQQRDMFVPSLDEDILPEDNDPPGAPADDIHTIVPIDDPATDDGIDSDELYQEGISGATGADDVKVEVDENPIGLDHEE